MKNVFDARLSTTAMGKRNYLIDGVSGTGKTTVCNELQRRGYQAIHGDRELAYLGDPETGQPAGGLKHEHSAIFVSEHQCWNVEKLNALVANQGEAVTFFCGGSRNFAKFTHLFDGVFVLEVGDFETLNRRIDERVAVDPTDWGAKPAERELIAHYHRTKEGISSGVAIDATRPPEQVVDEILARSRRTLRRLIL